MIFLAITDVTDRENHQLDLEKRVKEQATNRIIAEKEAETGRMAAENALAEIQKHKALLEAEQTKFSSGRTTTLDVLIAQDAYSQALKQQNLTKSTMPTPWWSLITFRD